MEDQHEDKDEDIDMYTPRPRRRKLHWLAAFVVLASVTAYFALSSHKSAAADPSAISSEGPAPAGAQAVLAKEMSSQSPDANTADGALTAADAPPPVTNPPGDLEDPPTPAPSEPTTETETPPPAPPSDPIEEAAPEDNAPNLGSEPEAAPEPQPEPPPPVKKSVKKHVKASAHASSKKHTLIYASAKVPKALKKQKVQAYLKKKLNGNTVCIPASLTKKQIKPFVATISLTKGGTISDIQIKPKLAQAKSITTCLKKHLAGSPALFKAKSTNRVVVSFKVK